MHGQVFPRFSRLIDKFKEDNLAAYEAYLLTGQRTWMTPEEGSELPTQWNGSPFKLSGDDSIIAAFQRRQINDAYVSALTTGGSANGGRSADIKVCKIQNDYIAADERATTLRFASPIRCAMMSSARKLGHSDNNGVFGTVVNTVINNLVDGHQ